ncbi:hypothetical protein Np200711_085 [Cyanophage S-RIM44]|uniref:Uncharacterized protein n=1 Tax=Cyanophage S-RIM44 TaxID=1278485 RepID=A0A1D7SEF3_9CAUD|nr:hypothetical protein Np200711_085 [Cyanophage S-RIM44]
MAHSSNQLPRRLDRVVGSTRSMLPVAEIVKRKCIVDKVSRVKEWIKYISEQRGDLGGHAICPYAFSASVHIEERALRRVTLSSLPNADVIIYILEDDISECALMQRVAEINMSQSVWYALDDHMDDATHINGVQSNFNEGNLLLIQKRDKLEKAREQLHKTDYYKHWSPTLYRRIINGK